MNEFTITGTYNSFDFIGSVSGFHLITYQTGLAGYKDGGVFADSKISAGRRPVYRQEMNEIDTVKFGIYGSTPDAVAVSLQNLLREVDNAFDYWTPGSSIATPVYMFKRLSTETNGRYAWIYRMELSDIPDLYRGEFQTGISVNGTIYACGLSNLTLTIERSKWLSHAPASSQSISLTTFEDGKVYAAHIAGTYAACVQFSSTAIAGDLPALGKITIDTGTTANDEIMCGFRATNRGANFTAYFNFMASTPSSYDIAPGVGGFVADATSPSGQADKYVPSDPNIWVFASKISIADMSQFKGRYRVFLRLNVDALFDNDVGIAVHLPGQSVPTEPNAAKIIRMTEAVGFLGAIDLGEIAIPPSEEFNIPGSTGGIDISIFFRSYNASPSAEARLHHLVILPIDEYVFDASGNVLSPGDDLIVDSTLNPRLISQAVRLSSAGVIQEGWQLSASHPFVKIPVKTETKLWFFAYPGVGLIEIGTISLSVVTRYNVLRGAG